MADTVIKKVKFEEEAVDLLAGTAPEEKGNSVDHKNGRGYNKFSRTLSNLYPSWRSTSTLKKEHVLFQVLVFCLLFGFMKLVRPVPCSHHESAHSSIQYSDEAASDNADTIRDDTQANNADDKQSLFGTNMVSAIKDIMHVQPGLISGEYEYTSTINTEDSQGLVPDDQEILSTCEDPRDATLRLMNQSFEYEKNLSNVELFNFHEKKSVLFIHIPKTGGTSVKNEAIHKFDGHKGNELSYPKMYHSNYYMLSFFRDPRAHVFSQFLHCKYNPYHSNRNYNGFQRTTKDAIGDEADYEAWLDHFLTPNFEEVFKENQCWDCYNPWNMQTRYMTVKCWSWKVCHELHNMMLPTDMNYIPDAKEPSIVEALKVVESLGWFGITEYYKESLCLLFYQKRGHLMDGCSCDATREIHNKHQTHHIHPHDSRRLNLRIQRKVDQLTRMDRILYDHARDILLARLHRLEEITNSSIIGC